MKRNKLWTVCVLALAVLMLCCGCASLLQSMDNQEIRNRTETMLDALIADDFQTAYQLVSQICTQKEFEDSFAQMQDFLGGETSYTLKFLSFHTSTNFSGGAQDTTISAVYEMTTPNKRIIINAQTDGQYNLKSLFFTPYEQTDYYSTGTLENIKDASVAQWAVLLLNLLSLGVTVFALVDCCRHRLKKKALWIILLLLAFISVGFTVSASGFRLNFNVAWLWAYSALIRYGSGTVLFRLMLPAGAIIYFIKRRSLLNPQTTETVPGAEDPTPIADEAIPGVEDPAPASGEAAPDQPSADAQA